MSSIKYLMFVIFCTFATGLGAIESESQQVPIDGSRVLSDSQNHGSLQLTLKQQEGGQSFAEQRSPAAIEPGNQSTDINLGNKGLSRYLWNLDNQETNESPTPRNENSGNTVARYLWDEENSDETDAPPSDPSGATESVARFLWDEEPADGGEGYTDSQQLAGFLWSKDRAPGGNGFNQEGGQHYFNDLSPEYSGNATRTEGRSWGFFTDGNERNLSAGYMQVASLGETPLVPVRQEINSEAREFILVGRT